MKYELVKIDRKNNAVLVSADGVQLWIDYFIEIEDSFTTGFRNVGYTECSLRVIKSVI